MTQIANQIAQQTVEHILALLRAELPSDLQTVVNLGNHVPGLLNQLPLIGVAAQIEKADSIGIGRTSHLKREVVDGAAVDLGFVTGDAGECQFTLTLWSLTRLQLQQIGDALQTIPWIHRPITIEFLPTHALHTNFRRCQLARASTMSIATLEPTPPHLTISAATADARDAPNNAATILGQVTVGQILELSGRSADSNWLLGCGIAGQPGWFAINDVEPSVPIALIPIADESATISGAMDPLPAGGSITNTVWQQTFTYLAYLEATREPLASEGEAISELRITRELGTGDTILDTERTRLLADSEEVVDEFVG